MDLKHRVESGAPILERDGKVPWETFIFFMQRSSFIPLNISTEFPIETTQKGCCNADR